MKKTLFYIFLGLLLLAVSGYFYANHLVKTKVENFLAEQLSPQVDLTYGDLYMSTFTGTISIEGIDLSIHNQTDTVIHTRATIDKLRLSGFGYYEFFFNEEIEFDQIDIDKNNIVYFKERFVSASKTDSIDQDPLATVDKTILIKALNIEDTSLTIYDESKDSVVLNISKASLAVKDIRTDASRIKKRIPIIYEHVLLQSDSMFMKISPYEDLTVKNLKLEDHDIYLKDLSIKPKYSKQQYARMIPTERDYTILEVPSASILNYDFGFTNGKLFAKAKQLHIDQPNLSIYRDKLVADDTSFKPLYSKMLRDLKMELMVDSIQVSKAHIVYEEKAKADQPAGSIEFTEMDIDLSRVGNTQAKGEKTTIVVDGKFQQSKLHVDWTFDVHNTSDVFRFSGRLGKLPAQNINSFVQPNLNVGFEGTLDEVYFDISGDNSHSQTSIKMKYEDFKVIVMRKNGKGKNKLVSGIVNLFVAKNSEKDGNHYREGSGDSDRNKTKSIFNFVWVSILSGLLKTLT
ncbi:hypothetical protein [Nonlabens marinus]|uniref:DUF748 domain-containing protein n=1 Tax=Nonlabens marinus S1-08 TaxID=1454201 RepID=W8VWQ0_9FLAO|nr:hypothetical protein [Nonlabens marinus]BAO54937.1 hypothetical protein NMS_0928 [Nonlabens marinus S1-08]